MFLAVEAVEAVEADLEVMVAEEEAVVVTAVTADRS